MSEIMSYDRWMKYTYGGRTSIRSSQLKAIDSAAEKLSQRQNTRQLGCVAEDDCGVNAKGRLGLEIQRA